VKAFERSPGIPSNLTRAGLSDLPHGLLVELVSVTKRNEYTDHAAHPFDAGFKVTSSLS
jgi:hypothetical protein